VIRYLHHMAEPKNYREVGIQLDEFRKNIESRLTLLLTFIGALLTLVGWVAYQLYGLKTDFAVVADRVVHIERDIKEMRVQTDSTNASAKKILEVVQRLEATQRAPGSPSPPTPGDLQVQPLSLSGAEISLIRVALELKPTLGLGVLKFKVGDLVPSDQTRPFPDELLVKLPKLKGFRYAPIAEGVVAVVDAASNRIAEFVSG